MAVSSHIYSVLTFFWKGMILNWYWCCEKAQNVCVLSFDVCRLNTGIQTFSSLNFKVQWPLHNVPLKVCWKYAMQPSFIRNLSKITRPLLNLFVHGMRPNLSLVHGMWMRLIEVAQCVISINWTHLSETHALGLLPIVFYKHIPDYCKHMYQGFSWVSSEHGISNKTLIICKSNIPPCTHLEVKFYLLLHFIHECKVCYHCSYFERLLSPPVANLVPKSGNLRSHGVTCDLS